MVRQLGKGPLSTMGWFVFSPLGLSGWGWGSLKGAGLDGQPDARSQEEGQKGAFAGESTGAEAPPPPPPRQGQRPGSEQGPQCREAERLAKITAGKWPIQTPGLAGISALGAFGPLGHLGDPKVTLRKCGKPNSI